MNVGILGVGEVGGALLEVYKNAPIQHEVFTKDIKFDNFPERIELLNVCIPYKERARFVNDVMGVIDNHRPIHCIIHSTVGVGTTRTLSKSVEWCEFAHSPVRGIHPNIYTGMKTFPKFFGCTNTMMMDFISMHYNGLGLEPWCLGKPETTETLKLWDTTVYGVNIALGKHIKKFCDKHGADYDSVMRIAAVTYNRGFEKMGNESYRRYSIKDTPGKIGGHCVIPNANILWDEEADLWAHDLLVENETY